MAPLTSGNYTIRDLESKYYLVSDGTDALNTWVTVESTSTPGAKNVSHSACTALRLPDYWLYE